LTQIAGDARATGDELATGDAGARGEAWVAGGNQARVRELLAADGRRIDLPGLYNLRDVGGYPAAGGPIPWRTLLRSDALHHLDETGVTILASLGLRTIIDLRTHVEAEIAPSPLGGLSTRHAHVSLLGADLPALPPRLEDVYAHIVGRCGVAIADAIRPLCAENAFPALVHCSAGKDRTGIVVAMILAVLGVPDDVIAADYALSGGYLDPTQTAAIGQLKAGTGLGDELTEELLGSPPQLILEVLTFARDHEGSVDGYLLAHGLSPAELTRLRTGLAGAGLAG
jgi:protein-tyrosine phosphatase